MISIKVYKPCPDADGRKMTIGAYIPEQVRDRLDKVAGKLDLSRSEAAGYILTAVLEKDGVADELVPWDS